MIEALPLCTCLPKASSQSNISLYMQCLFQYYIEDLDPCKRQSHQSSKNNNFFTFSYYIKFIEGIRKTNIWGYGRIHLACDRSHIGDRIIRHSKIFLTLIGSWKHIITVHSS